MVIQISPRIKTDFTDVDGEPIFVGDVLRYVGYGEQRPAVVFDTEATKTGWTNRYAVLEDGRWIRAINEKISKHYEVIKIGEQHG